MSGGSFRYDQFRINDIADEIDAIVADNEEEHEYSEETIAKIKRAAETCREASKMVHRVDWLVSGDDGEKSFHERWTEDGLSKNHIVEDNKKIKKT